MHGPFGLPPGLLDGLLDVGRVQEHDVRFIAVFGTLVAVNVQRLLQDFQRQQRRHHDPPAPPTGVPVGAVAGASGVDFVLVLIGLRGNRHVFHVKILPVIIERLSGQRFFQDVVGFLGTRSHVVQADARLGENPGVPPAHAEFQPPFGQVIGVGDLSGQHRGVVLGGVVKQGSKPDLIGPLSRRGPGGKRVGRNAEILKIMMIDRIVDVESVGIRLLDQVHRGLETLVMGRYFLRRMFHMSRDLNLRVTLKPHPDSSFRFIVPGWVNSPSRLCYPHRSFGISLPEF